MENDVSAKSELDRRQEKGRFLNLENT